MDYLELHEFKSTVSCSISRGEGASSLLMGLISKKFKNFGNIHKRYLVRVLSPVANESLKE